MSDYLNNLVARTLHLGPTVQPRLASLFEPVAVVETPEAAAPLAGEWMSLDAPSTESTPDDSTVRPPVQSNPEHLVLTAGMTSAPLVQKETHAGGDNDWNPPAKSFVPPPPALVPSAPLPPRAIHQPVVSEPDTEAHGGLAVESESMPSSQTLSVNAGPTDPGPRSSASAAANYQTTSRIRPEVRRSSPARARQQDQAAALTTLPPHSILEHARAPEPVSANGRAGAQAPLTTEGPETIVVTIGRVDVRAVFAPPTPAPRSNRVQQRGPMSLDEYLKHRSEGRR